MNKIRYQRLEDFERKRQSRKVADDHSKPHHRDSDPTFNKESARVTVKDSSDEHDKLYKVFSALEKTKESTKVSEKPKKVVKGNGGQVESLLSESKDESVLLSDILPIVKPAIPIKSPNKIFHRVRRATDISDDYESSTALSSSSREGDFDDVDESFFDQQIDDINHPTKLFQTKGQSITTPPTMKLKTESSPVVEKPSWWKRLFGTKSTPDAKSDQKIVPTNPILVDQNHSQISLYRLFFIESRQVWRELLTDYADEWEKTKIVRNKCISNLIILTIFCGFGGMVFRFVEGAFESFYKCGVRRVKRDFVEHLWTSSHNLRFLDELSVVIYTAERFVISFSPFLCFKNIAEKMTGKQWPGISYANLRKNCMLPMRPA